MPPGTAAEGSEKARRAKLFVQTKSFQTTDKPTFLARGGFKLCKNKKEREESRCNLLHILDGGSKQALLGNFCKAAQTAIAEPMQFF